MGFDQGPQCPTVRPQRIWRDAGVSVTTLDRAHHGHCHRHHHPRDHDGPDSRSCASTPIVKGIIIVAAVIIDQYRRRKRRKA
jgi:hypothetical protein